MPFGAWLTPSSSPATAQTATTDFLALFFYDFRRVALKQTSPEARNFGQQTPLRALT
jgi:hypothetical protein